MMINKSIELRLRNFLYKHEINSITYRHLAALSRCAMRNRWASYDRYSCQQSICGAHLLRDLTYEHEQQGQRGQAR